MTAATAINPAKQCCGDSAFILSGESSLSASEAQVAGRRPQSCLSYEDALYFRRYSFLSFVTGNATKNNEAFKTKYGSFTDTFFFPVLLASNYTRLNFYMSPATYKTLTYLRRLLYYCLI